MPPDCTAEIATRYVLPFHERDTAETPGTVVISFIDRISPLGEITAAFIRLASVQTRSAPSGCGAMPKPCAPPTNVGVIAVLVEMRPSSSMKAASIAVDGYGEF